MTALHDAAVKSGAMQQLLVWTGFFELFGFVAIVQMLQGGDRQPGDFGFDPLNCAKDPSVRFPSLPPSSLPPLFPSLPPSLPSSLPPCLLAALPSSWTPCLPPPCLHETFPSQRNKSSRLLVALCRVHSL